MTNEHIHCVECGARLLDLGFVGAEGFSFFMGYGRNPKFNSDGTRNLRHWYKCPNIKWWRWNSGHDNFGLRENYN